MKTFHEQLTSVAESGNRNLRKLSAMPALNEFRSGGLGAYMDRMKQQYDELGRDLTKAELSRLKGAAAVMLVYHVITHKQEPFNEMRERGVQYNHYLFSPQVDSEIGRGNNRI